MRTRRVAPLAGRVVSVCTGAFLLAEAGLLAGRRVTTHWAWCEELARRWIAEHPGGDLSVPALAQRANLSPRQFARAFTAEVGMSPGRYVDRCRLETARRLLEDAGDGIEQVAHLRLRHAGDDAAGIPAHPRRRPSRVPAPLLINSMN